MTYSTTNVRLGPESTPSSLKKIIIFTISISIGSALINVFLDYFFNIPGPELWLSLSWWGLGNLFLWQPITFLFVHGSGYGGITFFFLLSLFFNMYILWVLGTQVFERVGKKSFFTLYFTSGILAGLITLLIMPVIGQYTILSGATPAILAILVVWTLIYPEAELLLFFLIPVKAKWLTGVVLGAIFLINLSNFNFIGLIFHLSGAFIGYLYALLAWGLHLPFARIYRLELKIVSFSEKIKSYFFIFTWKKRKKDRRKVIDIATGRKSQSDDEFVDAMLAKISNRGQQSLTWREKERLDKISKKKKEQAGG